MYASLCEVSGALHLDVFEQPEQEVFFRNLLEHRTQESGGRSQESGARSEEQRAKSEEEGI